VYFIMSGTVELIQSSADRSVMGPNMEHSFTIDIDESLTLDCSQLGVFPPTGLVNGRLHIDRAKAAELQSRRRHMMGELLQDVTFDIRHPGQIVGEVIMEEEPPPLIYSARASEEVVALKLTQENYIRALAAMYQEAESGGRVSGAGAAPGGVGSVSSLGSREMAPRASQRPPSRMAAAASSGLRGGMPGAAGGRGSDEDGLGGSGGPAAAAAAGMAPATPAAPAAAASSKAAAEAAAAAAAALQE
jgi:hypothetical protein